MPPDKLGITKLESEMNGHGHDFGHEFVSESVSVYEADSNTETRYFGTSDTESDTNKNRVMTSDTGMSENLGYGLGHGQTSETHVRSSLT